MKNKLKIDGEFKEALPILAKIVEAGFEAYFVGGSVRDRLLGLAVNDVDIATSAQPQEIKDIFTRTVDVGIEHGTVMVLMGDESYEITTFRTESTYRDFRRPDSVTFVRSLKEDLRRRDFTMNAIAMDIEGKIIDPFAGMTDLKAGIIRAVGNPHERFKEDALRMMRAVRFAAQLDFDIENETQESIKENAELLEKIAIERIQVEFEKLLMGHWHEKGLQAMLVTDLYAYCPKLSSKKEALIALMDDKRAFENPRQAWALLLYHVDFYNSSDVFNERAFLKAWKLSNQMINHSLTIFHALKKRVENKTLDAWDVFNLGQDFALDVESLVEHLNSESQRQQVKETYQQLPLKTKDDLAINGHHLMEATKVKPGEWIGIAIEQALQAVVYQHVSNETKAIMDWLDRNDLIPD